MIGTILGFECSYEQGNRGKTFVIDVDEKRSGMLIDSEVQMLKNYEISGILPLESKFINYKAKLSYEINGKSPISEIISNNKIDLQEYIKILLQILKTIDSSKKYFLNERNFVLDINYIFATPEYTLSLVYMPMGNLPNNDALSQISNNIVPMLYAHVNNQDVIPAKRIFDDFLSRCFSVSQLIENLNMENDQLMTSKKKKRIMPSTGRVLQILSLIITILSWSAFAYFFKSDKKEIILYASIGITILAILLAGIVQWLSMRKSRTTLNPMENAALLDDSRYTHRSSAGNIDIQPPQAGGHRDTVALYNATSALSRTACLVDNNGGNSINLDRLPIMIGRGESIGSYLVADTAISSKHARIEKEDSHYIITDLGSTNKTFINGKALNPHTKNQLKDGDIVHMGRTDFAFHE